jgi:hypothetical protein
MKLTESQIQSAITHQDRAVRDAALFYFAGAHTPNPAVMPSVRKAVESYGVQEAFSIYPFLETLALNDRSLPWVLTELSRKDHPNTESVRDYLDWLWDVVAEADPDLIARHQRQIVENTNIDPEILHTVQERLRLRGLPSDELWKELDAACQRLDEGADELEEDDVVYRLTEAIARAPSPDADRVMLRLMSKPAETEAGFTWSEIAAVRLAGELRLAAAPAALLEKLRRDSERLAEECARSLIKIGGDQVLAAVRSSFAEGDASFRMYASVILEGLRASGTLAACRDLLSAETDPEIRLFLAQAMLGQFDGEATEAVRDVILESSPSRELVELRKGLVVLCTLTGATFTELPTWRDQHEQDDQLRSQFHEPEFPVVDTYGSAVQATRSTKQERRSSLPDAWFRTQRVGRNELCPCGSGKKFKKCCLNK